MATTLVALTRPKKECPSPNRLGADILFSITKELFVCYLCCGLHDIFKLEVAMQEVDDRAWQDPSKEGSYSGDQNHQCDARWHFQFVHHVIVGPHEHLANNTKVVDVRDDAGGNHGSC